MRKERDLSLKIAARARDVAMHYETRLREEKEEEAARAEVRQHMIESARSQTEEGKHSARESAERQSEMYYRHLAECSARRVKEVKLGEDADKKLKVQQENLEAASKRVAALKRETQAKLLESSQEFSRKRAMIHEKRLEDVAKREKEAKEWRKRELEQVKRGLEFDEMRRREWAARSKESEDKLMTTSRSLKADLHDKHERQLRHWDEQQHAMSQRIEEQRDARVSHYRGLNSAREERAQQFRDTKSHQDSERELRNLHNSLDTQARITGLEQKKRAEELKEERARCNDFTLKSNLESLKWEMSVKKSDPGHVREGLSSIKAPVPSGH